MHALVANSPPLDPNSAYCNLLQCHHFADTSIIAENDGNIAGFISAYLIPDSPSTLFVWQVAIAESARGVGLASRMLHALLKRDACAHVSCLHTTITKDNAASWALFEKLAQSFGCELTHDVLFDKSQHFADQHDSEHLVSIGPLTN